jgi:hypothetical protein
LTKKEANILLHGLKKVQEQAWDELKECNKEDSITCQYTRERYDTASRLYDEIKEYKKSIPK